MKNPRFLKWMGLLVIVSLLALTMVVLVAAQGPNLMVNGGFEEGFDEETGVALGWGHFYSDNVDPGFYDDTWELVVVEGEHAQLLELIDATKVDTFAGVYQNVEVEPGQSYQLSFQGLVRSDEGSIDKSDYGYRMQYAIDLSGNQDWKEVSEWVELPWDEQPRLGPADNAYPFGMLEETFTATDDNVTIFIRGWKKWVGSTEGNYDIDDVQLVAVDAEPVEGDVEEALPETGDLSQTSTNAAAIALGASVLVIAALVGGAILNQRRRRA